MSLPDLPGEIKRDKFARALIRLGFILNEDGGKGSHCKLTWPPTQKSITLQSDLRKDVLRYVLKEIEKLSGITWENIKKEL